MTGDASGVGRWLRRLADTVRWIATSEPLPDREPGVTTRSPGDGSDRHGTATERRGPVISPAAGVFGWLSWLSEGEQLPEPEHVEVPTPTGRARSIERSWIAWLVGTERLPSATGDAARARRRRGFAAWLTAAEQLPDSEDRSKEQEG
jgi:hypothetical protein